MINFVVIHYSRPADRDISRRGLALITEVGVKSDNFFTEKIYLNVEIICDKGW